MSEEQLHEQIEAYLLGNMTVEEEAAFQAQIDADPALQAAVDAQRQAIKAIRLQSEADMRRKMDQWRQGANTPAPPPPSNLLPWLKWGLIMLAFVLLGWYLLTPPETIFQKVPPPGASLDKTENPQNQVVDNEKPITGSDSSEPENAPETHTTRNNLMAARSKILLLAFNPLGIDIHTKGQETPPPQVISDTVAHARALLRLTSRSSAQQAYDLLHACQKCQPVDRAQWLGHACFRLGKYAEAVRNYRIWQDQGFVKTEAEWFLLLACVANGDQPESTLREMIGAIQEQGHPHRQDFLKLKEDLKKAGAPIKY